MDEVQTIDQGGEIGAASHAFQVHRATCTIRPEYC